MAFHDLASLDYYLDAGAGYFGTKKACEPLHIQYAYDDGSVVVVNSTYESSPPLHASIHVHNLQWKELFTSETAVNVAADSVQRVVSNSRESYAGPDRIFFIGPHVDQRLRHVVSRNFYWVPATLTTFDWTKTDYTHTARGSL